MLFVVLVVKFVVVVLVAAVIYLQIPIRRNMKLILANFENET